MKRIAFVFVLLAAVTLTVWGQQPRTAAEFINRANNYFSRGDFDRAIEDYTQAIRLEPNNERAYVLRAGVYFNNNEYELAVTDLETALRIKPNDDEARTLLRAVQSMYSARTGTEIRPAETRPIEPVPAETRPAETRAESTGTGTGTSTDPIAIQANGSWSSRQVMNRNEMWYTVHAASNGSLTIETDGDTDTFMELYEGSRMLASDDDSGSSLNARIVHSVIAGTTYRIKVREYSNRTGGSFRIRALIETAREPIAIQTNGSWISQVMNEREMWYTVHAASNGSLTIETDGDTDTFMELYEGSRMLASDDDSGSSLNARIVHNVSAGTTYRIKVREYSNRTGGSFRIRATLR